MRHSLQPRYHADPLRVVGRRVLLVALLVVLVFVGRGVWKVYDTSKNSETLRAQAEMRMHELEEREARLKADIASLKSERGVEETLRETYGLGREGEGVVVIVEPVAAPTFEQRTWSDKLFFWR